MSGAAPRVELGSTGIRVTRIGFGAWAIGGGGYRFGWGAQNDTDSLAAIERALELGVNWIDTAAVYGLGRSEEVIGRALRGLTARPYIFTKVNPFGDENGHLVHDLSRDAIRRECDRSLERLGLDAVDLYQIHAPLPDNALEEAWSTLVELREEGRTRHIGVCNVNGPQLERLHVVAPVETLQIGHSLVAPADGLLVRARELGAGTLVYSPMGSGLLSGRMTRERIEQLPRDDWRRRNPAFREPRLSRNLELVERVRAIGERLGVSSGAVAVAWALRHPAASAAIVGFRKPEQVEEVVTAAALDLDDEAAAELDAAAGEQA